jgi:DNA-binding CsgD family transcriptional regulator
MENVIKISPSSNFSRFQHPCVIGRQQYKEFNITESDLWRIKRKDSGYSCRDFPLTIQKLRCLICLSKGLSPRKTADVLGISYQTLTYHLIELRYRLGFPSKKAMIEKLQTSDFGKSISPLPIDLQLLWKLIKEERSQKYLKH